MAQTQEKESTVKALRILTATVALAALSVLPVVAQAHVPSQDRDLQPVARPADQTPAQRTLARVLAREHHASPAAIDRQAEAAQRALARTLAKERHTYPAPGDGQQAANAHRAAPSGTFPLLPVLATAGLILVLATAATWRLRARSRPREAS
jgi:L-aminopeptidase/D-esterase-like protein